MRKLFLTLTMIALPYAAAHACGGDDTTSTATATGSTTGGSGGGSSTQSATASVTATTTGGAGQMR